FLERVARLYPDRLEVGGPLEDATVMRLRERPLPRVARPVAGPDQRSDAPMPYTLLEAPCQAPYRAAFAARQRGLQFRDDTLQFTRLASSLGQCLAQICGYALARFKLSLAFLHL